MRTRKRYGAVLGMALTVLLMGAVIGGYLFSRNYCLLAGKPYPKNSETLDLFNVQNIALERLRAFPELKTVDLRGTGLTVEAYLELRQVLPECEIRWQVPFQGKLLEQDTEAITITSLTSEDAQALALVTGLRQVEASACRDYGAIETFLTLRPDCAVHYQVALDGKLWEPDTALLELDSLDRAALEETLPLLSRVQRILIKDPLPDPETVDWLRQTLPGAQLFYGLADRDVPLDAGTDLLVLSGCTVGVEQAKALLGCYPSLEQAEMLDCGLTDGEMKALCGSYPEVFFLWETEFGPLTLRTDAEEVDLSGYPLEDPAELEALLSYFPKLRKVILSDCGLDNETLDALDKRHTDVRFVWTVSVGAVRVRTDTNFFAPVKTGQRVYEGDMDNLKYCPDIIAVDVGHMKLKTCDWAYYLPNLQYLIIADSWISDITPLGSCKKLVFLEMFMSLCRDYSPLLSCTALEDLNLCYTYGDPEPVRQMTWLKRLWWDGMPYTGKGIEADLPDTEVNLTSGSSTGGSWRQGERYKEQRDILGMAYLYG